MGRGMFIIKQYFRGPSKGKKGTHAGMVVVDCPWGGGVTLLLRRGTCLVSSSPISEQRSKVLNSGGLGIDGRLGRNYCKTKKRF